jgi:DNA-binding transcriptional LysR family regulator
LPSSAGGLQYSVHDFTDPVRAISVAHPRRYKDLQLPQLRSFCLAANHGNFTTAAEELNLSVSAVWQQVRSLEELLGASLLRRRGRAVELTADGRLLLEIVQPHLGGLDSLATLFEARRQEQPAQVSVAATDYLFSYNLPAAVQQFHAEQPAVRLRFRSALPDEVLQLVEKGDVELGIAPYDRDEPRVSALDYHDLFERQFTVLCAADHPLARKRQLRPDDLAAYPLILPPRGSNSLRMVERVLQRHQLSERIHVMMESRSIGVVCHYAALGLGISLAYVGPEISKNLPGLKLRVFDATLPTLPVALVVRKGHHLTDAARAFRDTAARLLRNG